MKEILDVGAGRWPMPSCTRAIDHNKRYFEKTAKVLGDINRPKSLHEYRRAKAERIPYPDSFFNKVVSSWALGPCIFKRRAYREIARVLKPHGRVEVRLLWKDRRYYRRIVERFGEVGMVQYREYKVVYYKDGGKQLTEFILCFRRDGSSQ